MTWVRALYMQGVVSNILRDSTTHRHEPQNNTTRYQCPSGQCATEDHWEIVTLEIASGPAVPRGQQGWGLPCLVQKLPSLHAGYGVCAVWSDCEGHVEIEFLFSDDAERCGSCWVVGVEMVRMGDLGRS